MHAPDKSQTTRHLTRIDSNTEAITLKGLMPEVYEDLRRLAHRYFQKEREGGSLQPTALVHEVYLRLADQSRIHVQGRAHFLALCAKMMRQILIDHARRRKRIQHGGGRKKVEIHSGLAGEGLDVLDVVALNDAIEKLAGLDEREARVVELKCFGGMEVAEIAEVLGVSRRTVEGDWKHARAWLQVKLGGQTAA